MSVILAGCSPQAARPNFKTTPSPSPTGTPMILQGQPCPVAPSDEAVPQRAGCVTDTGGDFDGDGERDEFTLYARLDEAGMPLGWAWVAEFGDGTIRRGKLPQRNTASYPEVVGAEDADARGLDEIFIKLVLYVYHSGGTREVGIFGFDARKRFFRVQADGEPFLFPVGGVSRYGEGAECRDVDLDGEPEFLRLRVDYVRYEVQRTNERIYEWRNRTLRLRREVRGRFAKMSVVDPLVRRYYEFACLAFDPPAPY